MRFTLIFVLTLLCQSAPVNVTWQAKDTNVVYILAWTGKGVEGSLTVPGTNAVIYLRPGLTYCFTVIASNEFGLVSLPAQLEYTVPPQITVYTATNQAGPWDFMFSFPAYEKQRFYKIEVEK